MKPPQFLLTTRSPSFRLTHRRVAIVGDTRRGRRGCGAWTLAPTGAALFVVQLSSVCPQLAGLRLLLPGGFLPFLVSLEEPYPDFTAPYLRKSAASSGENRIALSTCTPNATLYIASYIAAELRITVITDAIGQVGRPAWPGLGILASSTASTMPYALEKPHGADLSSFKGPLCREGHKKRTLDACKAPLTLSDVECALSSSFRLKSTPTAYGPQRH